MDGIYIDYIVSNDVGGGRSGGGGAHSSANREHRRLWLIRRERAAAAAAAETAGRYEVWRRRRRRDLRARVSLVTATGRGFSTARLYLSTGEKQTDPNWFRAGNSRAFPRYFIPRVRARYGRKQPHSVALLARRVYRAEKNSIVTIIITSNLYLCEQKLFYACRCVRFCRFCLGPIDFLCPDEILYYTNTSGPFVGSPWRDVRIENESNAYGNRSVSIRTLQI